MLIRDRLQELDVRFATAGIKFYFVREPADPHYRDDELVLKSKGNVLIETLMAGALGLPKDINLRFMASRNSGDKIPLLHPTILILTKFKRWSMNCNSTRPKTVRKNRTDRQDIDYLLLWLADKELKIEFDLYDGKPKNELLKMVSMYHFKLLDEDDNELLKTLEDVIYPGDWTQIKALPRPGEESLLPPTE
ncbi:hypothetical protein CPB84DRAFT_1747185 [Gymnopilus junonius]|uniref:Uncharacterized protein n=1 Tax=Gymnopilus junonius TaxID=109634 RepID=A0A9P5NR55_GYMJU|nr:hypothetical protein CPB84DRAFT_1747185 [Gymnopilus junonius]